MHCYEAVYCVYEGAVRSPADMFNWTQRHLVPLNSQKKFPNILT